jgi:hypothetical protein
MLQEYAASALIFAIPVRMNVLNLTASTASNVKKNAGHVQNYVKKWLPDFSSTVIINWKILYEIKQYFPKLN